MQQQQGKPASTGGAGAGSAADVRAVRFSDEAQVHDYEQGSVSSLSESSYARSERPDRRMRKQDAGNTPGPLQCGRSSFDEAQVPLDIDSDTLFTPMASDSSSFERIQQAHAAAAAAEIPLDPPPPTLQAYGGDRQWWVSQDDESWTLDDCPIKHVK